MVPLSRFVERTIPHERLPAPFDRRLRLASWVGTGLIGLHVGVMSIALGRLEPAMRKPGFFIVGWGFFNDLLPAHSVAQLGVRAAFLVGALGLAISTRGFSRGRLAAHTGAIAVTIAGGLMAIPLVLCVVVVVFNLALWALYAAFLLLMGFIAMYMIFGGLWAAFIGELT
jgi:hypothetical protein